MDVMTSQQINTFNLRKATADDLDFLIEIDRMVDLEDVARGGQTQPEGHGGSPAFFTGQALLDYQAGFAEFVMEGDACAWVTEDPAAGRRAATIMYRFRDRLDEPAEGWSLFATVGDDWLLPYTRFCEVFQLWVDPGYRRRGLATTLKQQMESDALSRGVRVLYTHTAETNAATIVLNKNLGYREIRRGPLWDDVVRVSLVKRLD
jgi:ribosomal protein S18 acetylase RimI-like enzyme